jgi:hypothetical protein
MGTTIDAVRVVLDECPAPAAPLTTAQVRATGGVRHAARQVLTEKEFRRRCSVFGVRSTPNTEHLGGLLVCISVSPSKHRHGC